MSIQIKVGQLQDIEARIKHLQQHAETAWARGYQMGVESNKQIALQATAALAMEREAHAETNARMTEALIQMENSK
jgi:hypothetical protein